jgi:hypothetical protein
MQHFGGRFAMTLRIEETPSFINDWEQGYENWRWSKYLQKVMKKANSESSDMRGVVATD